LAQGGRQTYSIGKREAMGGEKRSSWAANGMSKSLLLSAGESRRGLPVVGRRKTFENRDEQAAMRPAGEKETLQAPIRKEEGELKPPGGLSIRSGNPDY